MGKKSRLLVVERAKIVTLNEERYSEMQISKKLKFNKTAIHQGIVRFRNFGSFQDFYRHGKLWVVSQKDDHRMKRMVVRLPTSSSQKLDRLWCSKVQLLVKPP